MIYTVIEFGRFLEEHNQHLTAHCVALAMYVCEGQQKAQYPWDPTIGTLTSDMAPPATIAVDLEETV